MHRLPWPGGQFLSSPETFWLSQTCELNTTSPYWAAQLTQLVKLMIAHASLEVSCSQDSHWMPTFSDYVTNACSKLLQAPLSPRHGPSSLAPAATVRNTSHSHT
eukprot:5219-Rhodomonas_salina.1